MPRRWTGRLVIALLLLLPHAGSAQQSADPPIMQMVRLFELRENDTPVELGERLIREHPDDPALHALYIIAVQRYVSATEGLRLADEYVKRWPDEPWMLTAFAFAARTRPARRDDVEAAITRVRQLAPDDPHMARQIVHIYADAGEHARAIALVDTFMAAGRATPDLRNMRASSMAGLAMGGGRGDTAMYRVALDEFVAIRTEHPTSAATYIMEAARMQADRRVADALPLWERAIELSPRSIPARRGYWRAIAGQPSLSAEEKRARIFADMDAFLELRQHAAGALHGVGEHLVEMRESERASELTERLLRDHPATWQAARAALRNAYDLQGKIAAAATATDSATAAARYVAALREVIARPGASYAVIADTYVALFSQLYQDPALSAEDLWQFWEDMRPYSGSLRIRHVLLPVALADKGGRLAEAEQLAAQGLDAMEEELEHQRGSMSVADYADRVDWTRAESHSALGWVLMHAGRHDEAQRQLEKALEAVSTHAEATYRLGRLAEARGDINAAEEWYAQGRGREQWNTRSADALQRLYHARHGSLDGFDDYVAVIDQRARAARRAQIVASRIERPETVPAFELDWLDGGRFSSASLAGKVTVINFWGVWCGPCVREAPEIQKFAEQFSDHPDVVFLTVSNDSDPDTTREWMKDQKYDFPVLIEQGLARLTGVRGYPTTLFIDRDGRIVYQALGATARLVEEFTWRVELLLGSATDS